MKNELKFPFEKLEVSHLGIDFHLGVDVADFFLNILDSSLPNKYSRLVGQMEAAVSIIPQNIAE